MAAEGHSASRATGGAIVLAIGGGFDRNIFEPTTLMAMMEYLHLNPVRQGLVERASDWRWSSAGWYGGADHCGLVPDPIPSEWVPRG